MKKLKAIPSTSIWTPIPSKVKEPDIRVVSNSAVGVEVELEFVHQPYLPALAHWEATHDGSLRFFGVEFVSEILNGPLLLAALDELSEYLQEANGLYFRRRSSRTSMHVHVDISGLTRKQIRRFVALYLLYERALYTIAGRKRENNVHCIPVWKHSYTVSRYMEIIRKFKQNKELKVNSSHKGAEDIMYSGIGMGKWNKYSTIEFRLFGGWLSSEDTLEKINLLLSLKTASLFVSDDMLYNAVDKDFLDLTNLIFQRVRNKQVILPILRQFNSQCYSTMCKFLEE